MKRKLRVYIAGPISKGDLCHNVNQATAALVALAKAGCAPFCPHLSVYAKPCEQWVSLNPSYEPPFVMCKGTAEGNPELTHADWLGIDLAWVDVCDFLVRLPGESAGADAEVARAMAAAKPVFYGLDAALRFLELKGGGGLVDAEVKGGAA